MTLVVQPAARRDLLDIWDHNADLCGVDHADHYVAFLNDETERLRSDYDQGRSLPQRPEVRYTVFRKGRGHGHIAFYRVTVDAVEVLRVLHTAQDWRGKADRSEL